MNAYATYTIRLREKGDDDRVTACFTEKEKCFLMFMVKWKIYFDCRLIQRYDEEVKGERSIKV